MVAALRLFFLILCLTRSVLPQGGAQLTFSSNPVCSGEDVTLTITYASGLILLKVTVDAFNGTLNKGFLFFQSSPLNTTGVGVFAGKNFNESPASATIVSVTLTAKPELELDYNSSIYAADVPGGRFLTLTSNSARLVVYVPPSSPRFLLSEIIFNDSDSGVIACESRNGRPAASVLLTVSPTSGELVEIDGTNFVSVTLSSWRRPLSKWHNALAKCRITNNNCSNSSVSNSSVSGFVLVNYITNTSVPDVIYGKESVVLNCLAYISYFPGVRYNWTIPPAANVTGSLNVESITVSQGHTGSFYCTATNNVTMTSVVIVFTVSNSSRPSMTAPPVPTCELCWIIGLVLGIIAIVVIAVVLGVLCKRGHFSKGRKSTSDAELHRPDVRAAERSNTSKLHSVDLEYESLDTQRSSEPTYSQLVLEQNPNSATLYENLKSSKR